MHIFVRTFIGLDDDRKGYPVEVGEDTTIAQLYRLVAKSVLKHDTLWRGSGTVVEQLVAMDNMRIFREGLQQLDKNDDRLVIPTIDLARTQLYILLPRTLPESRSAEFHAWAGAVAGVATAPWTFMLKVNDKHSGTGSVWRKMLVDADVLYDGDADATFEDVQEIVRGVLRKGSFRDEVKFAHPTFFLAGQLLSGASPASLEHRSLESVFKANEHGVGDLRVEVNVCIFYAVPRPDRPDMVLPITFDHLDPIDSTTGTAIDKLRIVMAICRQALQTTLSSTDVWLPEEAASILQLVGDLRKGKARVFYTKEASRFSLHPTDVELTTEAGRGLLASVTLQELFTAAGTTLKILPRLGRKK
jgi:hypothetical protein